jgi:hypothetical protein
MRAFVFLALIAAAPCALANSMITCYQEPGTGSNSCIDQGDVRANGDTRASPLFTGSTKAPRRTSRYFVTNCARGVSTLRQSGGNELPGGYAGSIEGARVLSEWTCGAKARNDPALRPF